VADLFAGVRWRTPAVLRDLLARTAEAVLLRALADVDDAQGLARLETDPTVDIELRRLVYSLHRPARPHVVRGARRPGALLLGAAADPRGPPAFA